MARRIIYNILLAFIAFPALMLIQGYFGRYLLRHYKDFSGDFFEYTIVILKGIIPWISLGILFLVLLPYNILLYIYYRKKGRGIKLYVKVLLLFAIGMIIYIILGGGWLVSYGFLILQLSISLIIAVLHYLFIDKKIEITKSNK